MHTPYLYDNHVHSNNSPDAHDKIMAICESASAKNLLGFCFTDHCEVDAFYKDRYNISVYQSYFESAKAKIAFDNEIIVASGIELGQPMHEQEIAEAILEKYNFDYVLASVHNLKDTEDFYFLKYDSTNVYEYLDRYFDEILDTVKWGKFDCLAHLTYPLRYMKDVAVDLTRYAEKIDEILKLLAEKNLALEINTSGLRSGGDTHPSLYYVRRFYELGGKYVTIGSDAHTKEDVGSNIKEGMNLAKQAGFNSVVFYLNRKPIAVSIK